MSTESFEDELARRDTELEAARGNRHTDPETWDRVKTEYAEWRRGIRLLAGRPLGDSSMWPADVRAHAELHGLEG